MAEKFPGVAYPFGEVEDPDKEDLGVLFDGNQHLPETEDEEEGAPEEELLLSEEPEEGLPIPISRPRKLDSEGGEEIEI